MARKLIIAANWKMNKGPAETEEFIASFLPGTEALSEKCDIVVAPPFVSIPRAAALLADSVVALSAQNVSDQEEGALKRIHELNVSIGSMNRIHEFNQ